MASEITVQALTPKTSAELSFSAADAGGNYFTWSKTRGLLVNNASGGAVSVTIASHVNSSQGYDHDEVLSVGAGVLKYIDTTAERFKNPTTDRVDITYSAVVDVTVTAISFE